MGQLATCSGLKGTSLRTEGATNQEEEATRQLLEWSAGVTWVRLQAHLERFGSRMSDASHNLLTEARGHVEAHMRLPGLLTVEGAGQDLPYAPSPLHTHLSSEGVQIQVDHPLIKALNAATRLDVG